VNETRPGRLRALYEWITGATPPPETAAPATAPLQDVLPARIGSYVITRKLGEGGMGVVYEARDERLERPVALKTMSVLASDETARKRFWREARAAASVNHPNVCQIYEIGEHAGELFIAMELLEGEVLAERLHRGALSVAESMPVALGMLAALSALHVRGIVHRDLKPSNVFLTPHGVKLLDFGLARPDQQQTLSPDVSLTRTGMVMGTPRYMAPEQITGQPVDARSDLFAAGAILFEMLAGRPAFAGRSVVDVLHATLHEHPPALTGPPIVAAVDRVIRRALAKPPAERWPAADAMAAELRNVGSIDSDATPVLAQALTRLVVLPFKVLRPDPETDFLAFSLADAIATSLSGVGSMVVRSSAVAARFAGEAPDLNALATEAAVDRVVMGTLLRSGDQLRAVAQLVEAPGGTLLTSLTVQSSLGDLFRLQDDITRRIVETLSLPLVRGVASPAPDAPPNPEAYELYLRGNDAARSYNTMPHARDLYRRCLDMDPRFAPAWAQLGRCYRVIGKFVEAEADSDIRAEDAFRRALEINPRLSIAHKYYASLEAEIGQSQRAMVRLVQEAILHTNDPELFAGLVHACRYCGLFDESIAAHAEARRLDPNIPTSIAGSLLLAGKTDRLFADAAPLVGGGGDYGLRVIGLGLAGRTDEARSALDEMRRVVSVPLFEAWSEVLSAWLDRQADEMIARLSPFRGLKIQDDPEAMFQEGWLLSDAGAHDEALAFLQRAVAKGYFAATTLAANPQFNPLRDRPAFQKLLADAQTGRDRARDAFLTAGGGRLLRV
jgi:eukaryotic-like serine/threonine-protein kinase